MKLLPKSPMELIGVWYWFYYFTIRNDYYLAAREAKRSFTINKAVLNVKPDDKRIIQRKTQHLRYL
jgi:hypothetical protein